MRSGGIARGGAGSGFARSFGRGARAACPGLGRAGARGSRWSAKAANEAERKKFRAGFADNQLKRLKTGKEREGNGL